MLGFACPVDAKNGTQNTMIARALASGQCTLQSDTIVSQLLADDGGRVQGVTIIDGDGQSVDVTAEVVVLSCGAVETARLLLNSKTTQEPYGIGNNNDQVGRHLQGHYYPGGYGLFEDKVWDGVGPGATIATAKFNHDNDGIIGGGMFG